MRKSLAQLLVLSLILCGCKLTDRTSTNPQTAPPDGGSPAGGDPGTPGSPGGGTPLLSSVPMGFLDVIDDSGVAAGWSLTPARAPSAIQVAFYADGPKGTGKWIGTADATSPRSDVNQATGYLGDHGFQFQIPASLKDGQSHDLYAYGLSSILFYAGGDSALSHQSGYAQGDSWATDTTKPAESFVVYGPYTDKLGAGDYQARFELQVDNNTYDDEVVATLDINDSAHNQVLSSRDLHRSDFTAANASVNFYVPFTAPAGAVLEFRVYYRGFTYLRHVSTAIFPAGQAGGSVELAGSPKTFQFAGPPVQPPVTHTKAQIMDTQGDLMIWGGPEFALDCSTGRDPETGVMCRGDNGGTPRGLMAGWVWSLEIPRYTPARREQLYQKILGYGYTHVALQITRCEPGGTGYHGLYPTSAAECVGHGDLLNTVLREIRGHGLITWCTGITQNDPPEDGLDPSLCDLVMDDWDNTDQKDCHINAMAQWFPNSWHYVEMPEGAVQPGVDSCTPAGLLPSTGGGGEWIREAQRRDPKFVGVNLEISYPNGHAENLTEMQSYNAFWRDIAQNRFEIDTYWKFWEAYPFDEAKAYSDWFITNAPWLQGFMSGGTTHAPKEEQTGGGGFVGELDLHQAQLLHIAGDFADWPITTHIKKLELRQTGVHVELDNGYPDAWPDTADRPGMGPLLYSMGVAELINGVWYASAPVQLWRGLDESGGGIMIQDVGDGSGRGQLAANWFYDSGRWGPLASHNPAPGEVIGFFVCAGDCRDGNGGFSPVHERSNVVLFNLPGPGETVTLTAP